jgi:hypothetical protein
MNIQIIQVPYDSGHKNIRMGRGPNHFFQIELIKYFETVVIKLIRAALSQVLPLPPRLQPHLN